tara:strand:+ start:992 stop:1750 length:759 start_codon:yes stop_codon:yes gene_type:complete
MNDYLDYYTQHLKTYQAEEQRLKKQMAMLSMLRFLVFLSTIFGIYMLFDVWKVALVIVLLGIGIFIYLLSKYTNKKAERNFNKELIKINEEEIKINSGSFHHRNQGLQFQDSNHFYSLDIDLFGHGSFFQYINRTTIHEGTQQLADALKANNISDIKLRQEAIKELSNKPEWRQNYSATSSLVQVETSAQAIIKWMLEHTSFLTKKIKWVALVFSAISLVLLALSIFSFIDKSIIGYWLLLGLGITGIYLKK